MSIQPPSEKIPKGKIDHEGFILSREDRKLVGWGNMKELVIDEKSIFFTLKQTQKIEIVQKI